MKKKSIIVTGPTATGKTSLAADLCRKFNGEIISADSRQVYTGLDIGTGKDLDDYQQSPAVNYHLIDSVDPNDEFSLFDWRRGYLESFNKIISSQKLPVICGGTPLYIDMLLNDYELKGDKSSDFEKDLECLSLGKLVEKLQKEYPERAEKTDLTQKQRVLRAFEIESSNSQENEPLPECEFLILAPYWHRKVVHERIEKRLKQRWEGLKIEALQLQESGVSHERFEWFGLEYRYMSRMMTGVVSEKEAFDQLLIKIRQFAKRQDIWFRKIENAGHIIHWLEKDDKLNQAEELLSRFLNNEPLPEPAIKISQITYGPRTQ